VTIELIVLEWIMPSIVREISEWGSTLPYWEQAALEKIVSGVTITDDELDELLQYLLEDAGLADKNGERPALRFSRAPADEEDERHNNIRLKRIANLHNINALVPGQVLEFDDQLTVIFGSNGSGKSGYARVIASAAFTRGDTQILRDVSKPLDDNDPLSADLGIEIEGKPFSIHHEIGRMCSEMRSFYVFDSTSVRAHLTQSQPMSFSPAGLEYLTRLAGVTDGVRKCLQQRVDQLNCANPFLMRFVGGETAVTQVINTLGTQTDLGLIRQLGTLSDDEVKRIQTLDRDIAFLKSANIPEQITKLEQTISDLDLLAKALEGLGNILEDERVTLVWQNVQNWVNANRLAQARGVEQFQNPWFQQTGSQVWNEFIQAAYQLAQAETHGDHPYPEPDSHCLLCQQPLGTDAQGLLLRLWEYLLSDAQDKLGQANQGLDAYLQQLQALEFDLLDDQAVSYRHLQEQDPQTLQRAQLFIEASKLRRDWLIQCIQNHQASETKPLPENGVREINKLIGQLTAQRDELARREVEVEIQRLSQEKLELEHRKLLAEVLTDVVQFVENARWIETASSARVKRSTAHISKKYNELFDRLVTQEYIRLFHNTLKKLNCPLLPRIATRAQKGTTIKQIVLQTDESVPPEQASPEKVLSEGEQRAVALADFFTEVRLDKHSCGVVLDDPVTSLDFHWKATIAKHIIEEANRQQVIVFTHDLHFLYLLSELAEAQNINLASHWIEKFDETPGYVHLNNCPAVEAKYKTTHLVQEIYKQANDPSVPPQERERLLGEGFGSLRTCYEALVVFELFNGVVLRFDEQIRIQNLKDVVVNPIITKQIIDKVGYLSRFIGGHLHSDAFGAEKPTPKMLMDETNEYDKIKKLIKDSRKAGEA
jgi:ABC-type lipoprotein export system ATPase subunit